MPPPKCKRGEFVGFKQIGGFWMQACQTCDDPDSIVVDNACQRCPEGTQSDGNNNCKPLCAAGSIYQRRQPWEVQLGGSKISYKCVPCDQDETTAQTVAMGSNWSITKSYCQKCDPGQTRDPRTAKCVPNTRMVPKGKLPPPYMVLRCPTGKTPSPDGKSCVGPTDPSPLLPPKQQRGCAPGENGITDRRHPDRCIPCPDGRVANATHTACERIAAPPPPPPQQHVTPPPRVFTPPPPPSTVRPPVVRWMPRPTKPSIRWPTIVRPRPNLTHGRPRISRPHTIARPSRPSSRRRR
jgi:hypothetical protein